MTLYERIDTLALADAYATDVQNRFEFASASKIYGDTRLGMAFTVGQIGTNEANTISNITVRLMRLGSPGNISCNLYLADANHKPTGNVLSASTVLQNDITTNSAGQEIVFQMTPSYVLAAGTEYCFILYAASGDSSSNYYFVYVSGCLSEE